MPYLVCARSFVISAFDIRSIFLFFFSICKHTQYAKSTLNRKALFYDRNFIWFLSKFNILCRIWTSYLSNIRKSQYKLPNFSKVWCSGQNWSSNYLILWLRGLFSYVLSYLLPYLWVYCWDLLALSFSFDFYPIPRNICLEFLNIWSDENLFLIFWHLFHKRKR